MIEPTKKDIKMIQGLCVMAMVCLHLFDTREYQTLFKPLAFFMGVPLIFYFAQLSDFCVMGFAFCSGYAHFRLFNNGNYYFGRLKSLLKILIKYWLVLIVFTGISIAIGKKGFMPGTIGAFIQNAFVFGSSYNGAWWYLFVYIVIVLVSPLIIQFIKRAPFFLILLVNATLYTVSYYYRFWFPLTGVLSSRLGPLGMTVVEYMMGVAAAKLGYFSRVHSMSAKFTSPIRIILSVFLIITMMMIRTLVVPSLFVAPISGLVIITVFQLWKKPKYMETLFLWVGSHSTYIWLTHMFFYMNPFSGLVYKAEYPLCIFALMMAITILTSKILNFIENQFYSMVGL